MSPIQLIQRSYALSHLLKPSYRAELAEALCGKTHTQALILLAMREHVILTPAKEILRPVNIDAVRQSFWRLVQADYVQEEAQYHPRTHKLTHYNYALLTEGRALANQIHSNLVALIYEASRPLITSH